MASPARRQSLFAHEASDSLARTFDPLLLQLSMHAWTAVQLSICLVDLSNLFSQLRIGLGVLTHWAFPPVVVATLGDLKRLAEHPDGIFFSMGFNELISHNWPVLKIVTVF